MRRGTGGAAGQADPLKLVVDTNVLVSGLLWSGAPRRLIEEIIAGNAELVTSVSILAELDDVLRRAKLRRKLAASRGTAEQHVSAILLLATLVTPAELPPLSIDPYDTMILGTAVTSRADMIVTGDHGLLGLRQVGSIRIGRVADALIALRTS